MKRSPKLGKDSVQMSRGGSWYFNDPTFSRSGSREGLPAGICTISDLGFRVHLEVR
jgi:hypothetical protein